MPYDQVVSGLQGNQSTLCLPRGRQDLIANKVVLLRKLWPLATTFGFTEATHPGDYPSFAEIRIVSARLKDAIERAIGPNGRVQFFPATIVFEEEIDSTYSIMYFPDRPDVMDEAHSEMLGLAWGRITLDHTKLDGHHVFALPSASQASFVVSERARRIIEEHGIEGIQFNPIPVS